MYIPTMKHDLRAEIRTHAIPEGQPFTVHTVSKRLREKIERGIVDDRAGKAALAAVLALCEGKYSGKPLSSVRKGVLQALGAGWAVEHGASGTLTYLTHSGQRLYLPTHRLIAAEIAEHNTCHSVGADTRIAKGTETLPRVPDIARQMVAQYQATLALHAALEDTSYITYDPWYMIAAALDA